MNDADQKFRVYGAWQGLTAQEGELASSFSNLRLGFSAPVSDGGLPGLTTPEEMLLGSAVSAYCTAFMEVTGQMALDLAALEVQGELTRSFDELEGHLIRSVHLVAHGRMRTGIGFEKVHDMFRRAASLAKQRSPVLRALSASCKVTVEATFGEEGDKSRPTF